jgi:shikimate kinase
MSITLIGMPGSGKSFIGKVLAEALEYEFVDIDLKLEQKYQKPLQEILDTLGENEFLRAEVEAVLTEDMSGTQKVLAPGGSIVYSEEAMEFLQDHSLILFVDTPLDILSSRICIDTRGVIGGHTKNLEELWQERKALYEKYADRVIDGTKSIGDIVEELTWDASL